MATNGHRAQTPERPTPRRPRGAWWARIVSWGLFGLAAALAGVFIVHVARFEATAPTQDSGEAAEPVTNDVVVTNSRVTGFDREQQPYSVTAESAVQDADEPNRVHLKVVTGKLQRRSGDILRLAARTALFNTETDVLHLEGDVTLVAAGRFVAEMAKADVTLADKQLHSESPVHVTFDRGEITAGGLEITDDGNRVVFLNRAKATFGPPTKDDSQQ